MHTCIKLALSLLFVSSLAYGQAEKEEKAPTPFGMNFSAYLNNLGGGGRISAVKTLGNRQFTVSADFYTMFDPRETRIQSAFGEQGGKYTYGKLNHVFVFSPSVGIQQNLFRTHENNLVEIKAGVMAGPAIALLVPYKVEIFQPLQTQPGYGFGRVEAYDPDKHAYNDIIRRIKVLKEDLDYTTELGLSLKSYMYLDLAGLRSYVAGIQLGLNMDYFSEKLPILAFTDNKQAYLSGSIGLIFGFTN